MPTELEELVSFLHSPQPAVVQIALDNLVGYSQSAHQQVFAYDNYTAISDLKRLSKDKGKTTVSQSVTILANLCDDVKMRSLIVEDVDYLKFLVTSIANVKNTNADLMCILLVNLAKNDNITAIFNIKVENDDETFKSSQAMDCLMDCFVKGFDLSISMQTTTIWHISLQTFLGLLREGTTSSPNRSTMVLFPFPNCWSSPKNTTPKLEEKVLLLRSRILCSTQNVISTF